MGIYQDSNYVQSMRAKQIESTNRHMEYQNFSNQYKTRIEQGMTRDDFIREVHPFKEDMQMFDKLQSEIQHQTELNNAFEQGLRSVWNK
jgi:hypothetical protein